MCGLAGIVTNQDACDKDILNIMIQVFCLPIRPYDTILGYPHTKKKGDVYLLYRLSILS